MNDQFRTCPDCGRLLLGSWRHDCNPPATDGARRPATFTTTNTHQGDHHA